MIKLEKIDDEIKPYREHLLHLENIKQVKDKVRENDNIPILNWRNLEDMFINVGALFLSSIKINGLNGTSDIRIQRALSEMKLKSHNLIIRRDANARWVREFKTK